MVTCVSIRRRPRVRVPLAVGRARRRCRAPGWTRYGADRSKILRRRLGARDVTTRRIFEDIVVSKLQAAGAQAVPAWRSFGDEVRRGKGQMEGAVAHGR
jgi:hypothetical protein